MIQEYLFIDDKDKETIKNSYKETIVATKTVTIIREIENIENSTCWVLKFNSSTNTEDAAKHLSDINEEIINTYHPVILESGCSAYFNRVLFPLFNDFERKLRKLLYLKSVVSIQVEGAKNINDLEHKNLNEIFQILFLDNDFVNYFKNHYNSVKQRMTQKEIIEFAKNYDEDTLWKRLLGDAVPTFIENINKVKNFRNDTMHAHNIDRNLFNEARSLIQKVNKELDDEINKIIANTEDPNDTFNEELASALKQNVLNEGFESTFKHIAYNEELADEMSQRSKMLFPKVEDVIKQIETLEKRFKNIMPDDTEN